MSTSTFIIQAILRIIKQLNVVYKQYKNPARNTRSMLPKKFHSSLNIESWEVEGFTVLTIKKKISTQLNKHILFLHGGAYIIEASSLHRKFIETLVKEYGLIVTFIDYPKAPEHNFKTTHKVVLDAYLAIVKKYPNDDFFLFGDSAGGGLALALLQILRDKHIVPFPKKTVLSSPWVDITMENELIKDFEKKDNVLTVEALRYAANAYSGGEDMHNPMLSPIYGDMANLGKINLYFGTEEILYPDCMLLVNKLNEACGTSVNEIIGDKMMHDWVVVPLANYKNTIRNIAQFYLHIP